MDEDLRSRIVSRLRAAGCVFAEDEAALLMSTGRPPEHLWRLVERRAAGTPLEYVLGWAEFCGLRIEVDEGVFVPRRRTEFLVQEALALVTKSAVVIDLCCGTGAVGRAFAEAVSPLELHAADVDPRAVACAQRNLEPVGGHAHTGDLFSPLPPRLRGSVDVLLVNAPYVPHDEIGLLPPEARDYEPAVALDGGADGLDVHRRVLEDAAGWLAAGGHLLIETSERQSATAAALFAAHGLKPRVMRSDELEATVVIGQRR